MSRSRTNHVDDAVRGDVQAPEPVVAAALARHAHRPGALLPVLHEVQRQLDHLPEACVAPIARGLNLSRAEVHGVISFYRHFRQQPPSRHIVQVCQAEACQSMGAEQLMAHVRNRLDCDVHGRSGDGVFSLVPVYCFGQCANAPTVMVDGSVFARVTRQRLDDLIATARITAPA